MPAAPPPLNETERLAALHALDVLRPDTFGLFDRPARIASSLFDGAFATVVFVDRDELFHRGRAHIDLEACPRASSVCSYVIAEGGDLWIEDCLSDPRVSDFVSEGPLPLRFFAGSPVFHEGYAVGAVCVAGEEPLALDVTKAERLRDLAELVGDTLATRLHHRRLESAFSSQQEAERVTQAYMDHAPVALLMLDRQMRYLFVSPRWRHEFGLEGVDLAGKTHYEVTTYAKAFVAQHQRALAGDVVIEHCELRRPDGSIRKTFYEMAPWRDAQGEIGGIIIASLDVSEAAAERERALTSERRLALALELSGTGVWEVDAVTGQSFATGPAIQLFGGRDLACSGVAEGIDTLAHVDDRGRLSALWDEHLRSGAPYDVEHRLDASLGDVWVQSFAEAVRGPGGEIESVVGALRDITPRKQVELELADAIRAADASNRAKGEFLANMSHELRTPLNGITGVTGALSRTTLDEKQAEMVGLIETSADSLSRLLSDVLDLARVESGKLELMSEPFDLEATVHGVGTLFQWRARDKGVNFRCEVQTRACGSYRGDVARLRQILSNLLSNAVKFTDAGGVSLSAGFGSGAGELCFTVCDTGIGFTPEQGARLFDRFAQGDGSITRRFGGSGLGLAISRALAEQMGGRLEADGELGHGATFTLVVPAVPTTERQAAAPVPDTPSVSNRRGGKVLLAEDHPINRKVVELILGSGGFELTSVENGAEALAALERERFDVVLMDVQMPVLDGLTAIRTLRAQEARRGSQPTPVIALTANAMPEHCRASLDAGADEHMTKPVSASLLLGSVARLVAQADARARAVEDRAWG